MASRENIPFSLMQLIALVLGATNIHRLLGDQVHDATPRLQGHSSSPSRASIRYVDVLVVAGKLLLRFQASRLSSCITAPLKMFRFSMWKTSLFLSALLLGTTFAGRLDEVARRKGFHPNAVRDLHAAKLREREEQAKVKPRYLNDNTKSMYNPVVKSMAMDRNLTYRVLRGVAS